MVDSTTDPERRKPVNLGRSQHRTHIHWSDEAGRIAHTSRVESTFDMWFPERAHSDDPTEAGQ